MFAIALWDAGRRKLVLARDRLGKKPLYYALAQGNAWTGVPDGTATRAAFASELKAFAAHGGVPRELDAQALAQYLAVEYVPAPRSIHRHVFKLPAGHVAVLDERGFRMRRYWELPAPSATRISAHEAGEELVRLLDGAVARRLVADVPVGVFLSGGIDSTTIAALAARHKDRLQTFSIGFTEQSFDETPFAELASERLGTRHATERLSGQDCLDLLPDAVRLATETGNLGKAQELAGHAVSLAAGSEIPHRQANALYCRGLLEHDSAGLLTAAERYADAGRPLLSAKALEAAATEFLRGEDRDQARAAFIQAVEVYTSLGAAADVSRLQAVFRAHGIRRGPTAKHRQARSGWDSLTATETKVAALVVEGLSNPEIATKLLLSRRTVATHVSHILRKLGVNSRIDIAREAALRTTTPE